MRSLKLTVVTLTVVLAGASACASDDSEAEPTGGATESTAAATTASTTATTAAAAGAASDSPTSMDEWEALWAEERAAVVAEIQENGWGKTPDGNRLVGPEGFEIDLAACPAGWDDTEGLTDSEILFGLPIAQSGPLAESAGAGRATDAVFRHYSDEGAFTDNTGKTRSITLVQRDDAYDPARTIPLVDELIDSVKVFAVQTHGSPNTLRTYDKLNTRCVPHALPISGHPALGDPVNHPWTTTSSISYATEAVIWGAFFEQRLAELGGRGKIAGLLMNNDFGLSYDAALRAYLETSEGDIEYVSEKFEPTAATVTDEMTTLASEDPDMFIAMSAGSSCAQIMTEAAQNGMHQSVDYLFISSACKAGVPIIDMGSSADGWWSVAGGLKDVLISAYDDDPFVVAARQWTAEAGHEPSPSFNLGLYYSWAIAQGIQIAGQLDGGLTRTNLMLALRSIDMTHPMLLGGLTISMNGNADAYLLEGSDISYWDAAQKTWVQETLVNLDGRTPLCAWDQNTSACA
ncbi:MAG: ABC transporter substrate-binding protein [Acidimicrobiia bacterium]|nr:ABC transporter substrate-binding protein [Acidimicrobiia bacterium]